MAHLIFLGNKLSCHGFTPAGVEFIGKVLELGGHKVTSANHFRYYLLRLADMIVTLFRYNKADMVLIDTCNSKASYYAVVCGYLGYYLKIIVILLLHGGDLKNPI